MNSDIWIKKISQHFDVSFYAGTKCNAYTSSDKLIFQININYSGIP